MFKSGMLFMIAGGALCVWGLWEVFRAQQSASWPAVEGTVISSKVTSESSGSGKSRSTSYKADVRYQYDVDGVAYEHDRLRIGLVSTGFKSSAQADVRKHPKGATTVYYDPIEPGNSVLEPGLHLSLSLKPSVGLLFFVVGAVMFRNRKYSQPLLSRDSL